ncbi:MAG: hypothetical protein EA426_17860, partial [Spirochaetaceae bacterium]
MKKIRLSFTAILIIVAVFSMLSIVGCDLFGEEDDDPVAIMVPDDYSTIQAAIDAASDGDTVLVAQGTYTENLDFRGKRITVSSIGFSTNPAVVAATIIDGGGNGRVVVFNSGETNESVLQGFTITGGYRNRSSGAGILVSNSSSPIIRNNVIKDNVADSVNAFGGGAYVTGESEPIFEFNTFIGNKASGRGAGIHVVNGSDATIRDNHFEGHIGAPAIQVGGASGEDATARIQNNTIENNNEAQSSVTGGIYLTGAGTSAMITLNSITNNKAAGDYNAGGIAVHGGAHATIAFNTITGNDATNGGQHKAGGIQFRGGNQKLSDITDNTISGNKPGGFYIMSGTLRIARNTITENEASRGGGIEVRSWGTAVQVAINDNTISNNTAQDGGGIALADSDAITATITNNIISGNEATGGHNPGKGGAIYINGPTVSLFGNTITGNHSAWRGGGIYFWTTG